MCTRMQGMVKWYDYAKGFGFVVGDNGADFFIHYSNIRGGHRPLRDGASVEFTPTRGPKGFAAIDVVAL